MEAHTGGVHDLHLAHALLEQPGPGAAVALEGELHVGRRHRVVVVELDALADDELVGEAVLGHRPRLGQARRVEAGRHRLHQRVVQGVEHHERRDDALGLGGIEPARRKRDVHAPRHRAFGRGGHRIRAAEDSECEEHHDDASDGSSHWHLRPAAVSISPRCPAYRRSLPCEPPENSSVTPSWA